MQLVIGERYEKATECIGTRFARPGTLCARLDLFSQRLARCPAFKGGREPCLDHSSQSCQSFADNWSLQRPRQRRYGVRCVFTQGEAHGNVGVTHLVED